MTALRRQQIKCEVAHAIKNGDDLLDLQFDYHTNKHFATKSGDQDKILIAQEELQFVSDYISSQTPEQG